MAPADFRPAPLDIQARGCDVARHHDGQICFRSLAQAFTAEIFGLQQDLHAFTQGGLQALIDRDLVVHLSAVPVLQDFVGIGTYQGHLLQFLRAQRQDAVVLHQDDGTGRRLAAQGRRFGRRGRDRTPVAADGRIGVITAQQTQFLLHVEVALDRLIEIRLCQQAAPQRLTHRPLRVLQLIGQELRDARLDTGGRRLGEVGIDVVIIHQPARAVLVRDDDAILTPFGDRHGADQGMDGHRSAAGRVVGSHETAATCLGDAFHESVGIVFTQLPFREVGGIIVAPVLIAVGDEMLQHAGRAPMLRIRPLGSTHIGFRHFSDQPGVLTVTLFGPAPARVASQVDIRAPDDQTAAVRLRILEIPALLQRDLRSHPFHQLRVPGLRQSVRLRERSRRQGRMDIAPGCGAAVSDAMHAFGIVGNRDTEARDAHIDRQQMDLFVQGQVFRSDAGLLGKSQGAGQQQGRRGCKG